MYLTEPGAADAVSAEHGRLFHDIRPAATMAYSTLGGKSKSKLKPSFRTNSTTWRLTAGSATETDPLKGHGHDVSAALWWIARRSFSAVAVLLR
jgi:hypothetical protein